MTSPAPTSDDGSSTGITAIRDLAIALSPPMQVSASILKGVITASNPNGTPPNVSLQISGDSSTTIDMVRYIDSYSPVVGDTVLITKQGSDIFVLGQMNDISSGASNGWQTPSLGSGFTTNGNSSGALQYRLVVDHGENKVQWRGSVAVSGTPTAICTLVSPYVPTARRPVFLSRDNAASAGGNMPVLVNFNTDGTVAISTATTGADTTAVDPVDVTTGFEINHGHTHGLAGATNPGFDEIHTHGVTGSHYHTAAPTYPTWISFNNVEYFLNN